MRSKSRQGQAPEIKDGDDIPKEQKRGPVLRKSPKNGMICFEIAEQGPALGQKMSGLANRNLPDPTGRSIDFLPKEHIQMCGVFLDVPHVIEQQLGDGLERASYPELAGARFHLQDSRFLRGTWRGHIPDRFEAPVWCIPAPVTQHPFQIPRE